MAGVVRRPRVYLTFRSSASTLSACFKSYLFLETRKGSERERGMRTA